MNSRGFPGEGGVGVILIKINTNGSYTRVLGRCSSLATRATQILSHNIVRSSQTLPPATIIFSIWVSNLVY